MVTFPFLAFLDQDFQATRLRRGEEFTIFISNLEKGFLKRVDNWWIIERNLSLPLLVKERGNNGGEGRLVIVVGNVVAKLDLVWNYIF